jgi:hypothetical protein
MEQVVEFNEAYKIDDAPVSALLSVQRDNRYGSVPGLDDSELADPLEIEREIMLEEWGPVLALPVKGSKNWIGPVVGESGGVDWGAFGTVDFDRYRSEFDKAKYKADKLRERLKDMLIMVSIVAERLPGKAKYMVLKYLRMDIIGLNNIINTDMLALARLYLRVERLRSEIRQLERTSEARRRRRMERLFAQ